MDAETSQGNMMCDFEMNKKRLEKIDNVHHGNMDYTPKHNIRYYEMDDICVELLTTYIEKNQNIKTDEKAIKKSKLTQWIATQFTCKYYYINLE